MTVSAMVVTQVATQSIEEVWHALLDCTSFPSYMDDVSEVEILDDSGARRVTRWAVLLNDSELEWTEQDIIDHGRYRLEFHQIEGDLARFEGQWQLTAQGATTLVELRVTFDIGIPMMADMLNPVAARALEKHSRAIIEYLNGRAKSDLLVS